MDAPVEKHREDWTLPPEFEEYRLIKPIGQGSMGRVYLAHDTLLDRLVAIKFINQPQDGYMRERFLIEARAAARLEHPNVVTVYRVGMLGARPFIASEFLRGKSLDKLDKPQPSRRVLEIGLDLASGLAAAHRRRVLHRDIKPANAILTDEGRAKLVDFGLAKFTEHSVEIAAEIPDEPEVDTLHDGQSDARQDAALAQTMHRTADSVDGPPADEDQPQLAEGSQVPPSSSVSLSGSANLTQAGAIMGTPYYMAPEVWRGRQASPASDVYSLGVVLYELCAGRTPHRSTGLGDLELAVTKRDAPPLSTLVPDIDPKLSAVIARCLERDPRARFASADELVDALQELIGLDLERKVERQIAEGELALAAARDTAALAAAERAEAFAAYDAGDRDRGESVWRHGLDTTADADHAFADAAQALETALRLAPKRADIESRLADALYERALLAEARRRTDRVVELVRRLEVYDVTGERRRRWLAPAVVTLGDPSAFVAGVEQVVRCGDGLEYRPVPAPAKATELELEPGSYLLSVGADDRVDVRVPVLLRRGTRTVVEAVPPRAGAIPHGFAYVPAGEFLFGGGADEGLRMFYQTTPLHRRTTGAFLIARHAVTFADWIEFLEALSSDERARRLPRVGGEGYHGAIELTELPAGDWELVMQPTEHRYRARRGEPIEYADRDRRQRQDWQQFPVTGVSWEDAQVYAQWLDRTGKVPGARLPREDEWERAARGADARVFPHGDRLRPDDANFDETYGRRTGGFGPDEVGAHPASRSPFGLDDMAGNVIELVGSLYDEGQIIGRGGAYYFDSFTAACPNRAPLEPTLRNATLGFRMCADLPRSPGA